MKLMKIQNSPVVLNSKAAVKIVLLLPQVIMPLEVSLYAVVDCCSLKFQVSVIKMCVFVRECLFVLGKIWEVTNWVPE